MNRLEASGAKGKSCLSLFCILYNGRRKIPKVLLCQGEKESPLRSAEEGGSRGNPHLMPPPSQPPPSYLTQIAKQPSFLPSVRLTEFQLELPLLPLPSHLLQSQGGSLDPWTAPPPTGINTSEVEQRVGQIARAANRAVGLGEDPGQLKGVCWWWYWGW